MFGLSSLPCFYIKAIKNEKQLWINVLLTYKRPQSKHRKLYVTKHVLINMPFIHSKNQIALLLRSFNPVNHYVTWWCNLPGTSRARLPTLNCH